MESAVNWSELRWKLADDVRGARFPGAVAVVGEAIRKGFIKDWRDCAHLIADDRSGPEIADPIFVADFMVALAGDRSDLRVLDPWAGLGLTLRDFDDAGRLQQGVGIEINTEVHELAAELLPSPRIEWLLGDAGQLLDTDIGQFDLVVGSPPLGLPPRTLSVPDRSLNLRASATYTMIVQAALKLSPGGSMLVVLPDGFLRTTDGLSTQACLQAAGVGITAVLALPTRTFAGLSIPLNVVVLTQESQDSVFLGQVDAQADQEILLANLRARRNGALPELGRLVPRTDLVPPRQSFALLELREAARRSGLQAVAVEKLAVSAKRPRATGEAFPSLPNCVYVPRLGTSSAVTSPDQFQIKPQNYIQVQINPEIAESEYVAAFLGSALGRRVRRQLTSGTTIPQISIESLTAGEFYLPASLEQQRATVRLSSRLSELGLSLQALEKELWDRPLSVAKIEAGLGRVLEGDGFERWMESLPYPLASVIWRYRASDDAERRCRFLVNLFEALVVVLVEIHYSALERDPGLLQDAIRTGTAKDPYDRASIGIWANLLARLAAKTRQLVASDPTKAQELFALSDIERLNAIASKTVVRLLEQEAAEYRRNWIGHAAVVGPAEWARRLTQAEGTLAKLREALSDAFTGWELVRAGQGSLKAGVISASVEHLTGSRALFRRGSVKVRDWPEDGCLYMIEDDASLMLRLAPLIRLRRSPESVQDAVYFYDRIESRGVRWVSYSHEEVPEVVEPDPETAALIRKLDALG